MDTIFDINNTNSTTISEPVPETISETFPETISETISELVPETISETVPETISETISEPVPETISETVPETNVETVPETNVEINVETIPETIPETNVENISDFILVQFITKEMSKSGFITEYKLNESDIRIISLVLLKYPKLFDDMSIHITKIMNDNLVNLQDIPEILLLLKDVLNVNTSQINKLKITRYECLDLIKNILIILIQSNIIKFGSEDTKKLGINMIDLSIKLLETKVNVKKVINCFSFR